MVRLPLVSRCVVWLVLARFDVKSAAEPGCHMLRQCLSPGMRHCKRVRASHSPIHTQVWFQDIPFRKGVYECQPAQDAQHPFEVHSYHDGRIAQLTSRHVLPQESPVFQLQVTFAAMQHSALSAFNPVKLVESLKLRATEQQDAQECVAYSVYLSPTLH